MMLMMMLSIPIYSYTGERLKLEGETGQQRRAFPHPAAGAVERRRQRVPPRRSQVRCHRHRRFWRGGPAAAIAGPRPQAAELTRAIARASARYICTYIYIDICLCIHTHICIHTHVCLYYVYMYMYIHIHIHIHTCMYIYEYMCIYTHMICSGGCR